MKTIASSLTIEIKVVPSSGKLQCVLDKNDRIKCYLKSSPEAGKANRELIKFIAKSLRIPQVNVSIMSGVTSRTKEIKIAGNISHDMVLSALGIERQKKIF